MGVKVPRFFVLFVLILILAGCSLQPIKQHPASVEIEFAYSESANIFDLMDNVSNWWPGFTDPEYQEYWKKNIGLSDADLDVFKKYKVFRQKYYNDPDQTPNDPKNNRNGFFSTVGALYADPVAEAFYSSDTLEEAYIKLKDLITNDELSFLRDFYITFENKFRPLVVESKKVFPSILQKAEANLKGEKVRDYINKVRRFYSVKEDLKYRVLYVWWPPKKWTNAVPVGPFLVMRYNPEKHAKNNDSEIVVHEIIHTISSYQSLEQKRELTDQFLKVCPVENQLRRYQILEEPMAVVFGQIIFNRKFRDPNFSISEKLYNNKWITTYSRLVYDPLAQSFEKNETINDSFIDQASIICSDLLEASKLLK